MNYDKKDPKSIEVFAKKLVGKTLNVAADAKCLVYKRPGKGGFGQALEECYFGITPGNESRPDFPEAGVELKSFPLKRLKNGKTVAKERISLGMIDYMALVDETWETSSMLLKNSLLLLIGYLHEQDANFDFRDAVIKHAQLWDYPDNDLKIIKDDWEKILQKVRAGKAHELSEGDTLYLGAATKGQKNQGLRAQPYGPKAKGRALTLKQPYVNAIIRRMLKEKEDEVESAVKDVAVYREDETFEDYVRRKFAPYIGKTVEEINQSLGQKLNPSAKNYCATLTRGILGVTGRKIEEFEKAGVVMKTVRLEENGKPEQSMSFPAFKFKEIIREDWENSTLKEMFERRFFFVVFQRDGARMYLKKVEFWNMPSATLNGEVRRVWQETVTRIRDGRAGALPKGLESEVAHVRPHGLTGADMDEAPDGRRYTKKCFWLNRNYVAQILRDK